MKNNLRTAMAIMVLGGSLTSHAALLSLPGDHRTGGESLPINSIFFTSSNFEFDGGIYVRGAVTFSGEGLEIHRAPFWSEDSFGGSYYRYNRMTMSAHGGPLNGALAGTYSALEFSLVNLDAPAPNLRDVELPPGNDPRVHISLLTNRGSYQHTVDDPGHLDNAPTVHRFYLTGDEYFTGFSLDAATGPYERFGLFGMAYGEFAAPAGPVPEPETYVLMALGLGGIALVARRRKVRASAGRLRVADGSPTVV